MRVHHINAGTMCPLGGHPKKLVCHCLVIETGAGLALVDTGIGRLDMESPEARLGGAFMRVARPRIDLEQTAHGQITRLGLDPRDVRFILPTHLDLDHAGGLGDFPDATVFIYEDEREAAQNPRTFLERERYRAVQWSHGPKWRSVRVGQGEPWLGFSCVRELPGLPPEILVVPLPGHSRGHVAIAVQTSDKALLHCGDAYFHRAEMAPEGRRCPPALALFQRLAAIDNRQRMENQHRLRALKRDHGAEVEIFCAHDPVELDRLAGSP